jgi:hypothetical protein
MRSKTTQTQAGKRPAKRSANPATTAKSSKPTKRARPSSNNDAAITDPAEVKQPAVSLMHKSLENVYLVSTQLPMCFIFDYISPARLFKRGTRFTSDSQFIKWTNKQLEEATETDELDEETNMAKLVPFEPKPYK